MPILALSITDIQGPDHIVAAIQRDAIRSAAASRREPATVFAAITRMIERGYQVPTAAQAIRLLPRSVWTGDTALAAAKALIAWAAKTHASERTSRDYVESIQVADDLAGVLAAADADPLRKTLATLRVPVFVVRSVVEEMRYDTPRIVVPLGKPFEIIFENPDVMPHNLVVLKPGTRERVGAAAANMTPDERDDKGRAYLPTFLGEATPILAATKILETGQNETLRIPAIRDAGTYEFVCTFPGHWLIMYGQLVVTKDVDAYLKQNPVAAKSAQADSGKAPAGNAAPAHNAHNH
jgi:azurin